VGRSNGRGKGGSAAYRRCGPTPKRPKTTQGRGYDRIENVRNLLRKKNRAIVSPWTGSSLEGGQDFLRVRRKKGRGGTPNRRRLKMGEKGSSAFSGTQSKKKDLCEKKEMKRRFIRGRTRGSGNKHEQKGRSPSLSVKLPKTREGTRKRGKGKKGRRKTISSGNMNST